jgi:hypothetical protein
LSHFTNPFLWFFFLFFIFWDSLRNYLLRADFEWCFSSSAFWVARITGMRHWWPSSLSSLAFYFSLLSLVTCPLYTHKHHFLLYSPFYLFIFLPNFPLL